jgi:hypothetical protein
VASFRTRSHSSEIERTDSVFVRSVLERNPLHALCRVAYTSVASGEGDVCRQLSVWQTLWINRHLCMGMKYSTLQRGHLRPHSSHSWHRWNLYVTVCASLPAFGAKVEYCPLMSSVNASESVILIPPFLYLYVLETLFAAVY